MGESFTNVPGGTAEWSFAGDKNHHDASGSVEIAITARPIEVTADDLSKTYGNDDPELTFEITAGDLVPGDAFAGGLTREAGEDVGEYVIGQGTLALSDNYALSFVGGELTITPAVLTVSADHQSRIYGNADPELTFSADGFQFSDTEVSVLSGKPSRVAGENVSSYAIEQGTLAANANYTIEFTGHDLEIKPAPLIVTDNDKEKTYGDENPELTGTIDGIRNDEPITASFRTEATQFSDAGTYAIEPAVDADSGVLDNYDVTLVSGELTVIKADQLIDWSDPVSILAGTPLSGEQLNATVSGIEGGTGPGELTYEPEAGTILDIGTHTLTVAAAETQNYNEATAAVELGVLKPYSVSGFVWADFNNDGEINFGEHGIEGVTITLQGEDDLGNAVAPTTVETGEDGTYRFDELRPGEYSITETQPNQYEQGINSVGTLDGETWGEISAEATDRFFIEFPQAVLDADAETHAMNYNFGERPPAEGEIASGQTAGIGFWNNKHGQALIESLNGDEGSKQLGDWLAATFSNMFGADAGENDLTGMTNAEVARFFQELFAVRGQKLEAQVMATALAVYVTNETLAGDVAEDFGFTVTEHGVGTKTFNVGDNGAAFGVEDDTQMAVLDILLATDGFAKDGVLYHDDDANVAKALRNMANEIYSAINQR